MKYRVPIANDPNVYTCDGRVAFKEGETITDDTPLPCPHGQSQRFDFIEFDSMEEYEEWYERTYNQS